MELLPARRAFLPGFAVRLLERILTERLLKNVFNHSRFYFTCPVINRRSLSIQNQHVRDRGFDIVMPIGKNIDRGAANSLWADRLESGCKKGEKPDHALLPSG